jgi:hypothetical protein
MTARKKGKHRMGAKLAKLKVCGVIWAETVGF